MDWISVEDRLPEKAIKDFPCSYSNWVLTFSDKSGRTEFGTYNFDDKEWHDDFGEVATGITHWMPLPKAPISSTC